MMRSRSLLFALLLAPSVHAADSPKDVQALLARSDYTGAETMLREAIAEHPQSAKAHYVLAEVLAHEGNVGEAKSEAAKAATLDPGTHFTDPAKFQAFRHKLDTALAPASGPRASAPRLAESEQATERGTTGRSHLLNLLAIGAGIALLAFLWMRRRRADVPPAGYPPVPPPEGVPPYGPYTGGAPYGAPPQPRSGMGTAVAAGLGGVAAGMLLDEALRGGHDDGFRDTGPVVRADDDPSGRAYDDLRNEPIDMGNNDSSWDDTGSDGGTFDDDDSW